MPERKSINANPRKARAPMQHQRFDPSQSVLAERKAANATRYCACGKPATRVSGRTCWCSACWAKETM